MMKNEPALKRMKDKKWNILYVEKKLNYLLARDDIEILQFQKTSFTIICVCLLWMMRAY